MIQAQLKLRLTRGQESKLNAWLWNLTGVWNWAIRKIELDAKDKIYHSEFDLNNLITFHGKKLKIPSHTLRGVLKQVHQAWEQCFKKTSKRPHMKGNRNKLSSIPFPDILPPVKDNRILIPGVGRTRFHKQNIPEGRIKCGRIVKRSSGWYLCLFIDAERAKISRLADNQVGIDSGFNHLLTLSSGEKISHPREMEAAEKRISQAQRGGDKQLAARLQKRRANRVRDRNHKLSLRLVRENSFIAFSKDSSKKLAKTFGRSVSSSSHFQLRQMLAYKSRSGGSLYVEVEPQFSTMTCSRCGARNGPKGLDGLKVRTWECACGAHHDRDINAACNVLKSGLGYSLKETSNGLN